MKTPPEVNFLNSVVAGIGNIDVVRRVNRNPLRKSEQTVAGPAGAPIEQMRAGRVILSNSLAVSIHNVEIVFRVNRDTTGPNGSTTNKIQKVAARVELGHPEGW